MPNPSTIACDEQPSIQSWSREGDTLTAVPRPWTAIYIAAADDSLALRVTVFDAVNRRDAIARWQVQHTETALAFIPGGYGASILDTHTFQVDERDAHREEITPPPSIAFARERQARAVSFGHPFATPRETD